MLGLHFDHVPDPLGPCRGPLITAHGKSISSVTGTVGGGGAADTPGVRGPDFQSYSCCFSCLRREVGTCSVQVPGNMPALQCYSFNPQSSPAGRSEHESIILGMRKEKCTKFIHFAQSYETSRSRVRIQMRVCLNLKARPVTAGRCYFLPV